MKTLTVTWTMDEASGARPGTDSDPDNPLSRALSNPLVIGKPINRVVLAFFRDHHGSLRWFGAFVHTVGDRLLYFPGIPVKRAVGAHGSGAGAFNFRHPLGHFSLDRDGTWHMTSPGSKKHQGGFTITRIAGGTSLWFGLTVKDENQFRLVSQRTIISAKVPKSDVRRRRLNLEQAREGAQFPIFEMNGAPPWQPSSAHFALLIVDPRRPFRLKGSHLGFPEGHPDLTHPLPVNQRVGTPIRTHPILEISPSRNVQVVTAWIPAAVGPNAIITSPAERTLLGSLRAWATGLLDRLFGRPHAPMEK